jgi:L-threonylcarbamoyladenylate synthase
LAANALDETALLNVFKAKNRPSFDPLIVHVPNRSVMLKYVTSVSSEIEIFLVKVWPGSVTIVLLKRQIIPDLVTSGLETVGIRVPKHELTQRFLRTIDFPLAAPSANPFGYISPTTALHVDENLGDKVDYILDGGKCEVGIESTIIGFENEVPTVYRLGGMSVEEIQRYFSNLQIRINKSSNPKAPGMLKNHYAPEKPFEVSENIQKLTGRHSGKKKAIITFMPVRELSDGDQNFVLSPTGNLEEAALNLFDFMRKADQSTADIILAESVPEEGLGRAINDRLNRASTK